VIDQYGLIVDKTGDAGDSCNFTSCAIVLGLYEDKPTVKANAINYFWNSGFPVRHPFQKPWNNHKNFTRDQAILLMQVLPKDKILQFITDHSYFFPNFERDWPGSVKCPWPHRFWKDSRPTPNNLPLFGHIDPPTKGEDYEIEFKWFDYADPMTPDFTAMSLILAGEKPISKHMAIARFLCRHAIENHCARAMEDKTFVDFKQLYFTAKALGLHLDFAAAHPWGLHYASWKYFTDVRSLPEIDAGFEAEFKKEGILE